MQIDMEPQGFEYKAEQILINKFDVFGRISIVPVDILLAQKIYCIFARRRPMGRDVYDAIFLMGKTKPNLDYLNKKLHIRSFSELKSRLTQRCKALDSKQMAKDVEPFLFNPTDSKKVLFCAEYIENYEF
jgi:predicted nucleotidyltransferase component of viral defense system